MALIAGPEDAPIPTLEVEAPPEEPQTPISDALSVKSGEGVVADEDDAKSTIG